MQALSGGVGFPRPQHPGQGAAVQLHGILLGQRPGVGQREAGGTRLIQGLGQQRRLLGEGRGHPGHALRTSGVVIQHQQTTEGREHR